MTNSIIHFYAGNVTHLIRHTVGIEVATVDGEVLYAASLVEVNAWQNM
jgi:hypothetical protein